MVIKKYSQYVITLKCVSGFSIVELMVAILIGLILISAVMGIYVSTVKTSRDLLSSASLSQELTAVMSILVNDIRRSGYWSGVNKSQQISDNPFYLIEEKSPKTIPALFRMPYAINISDSQDCISFAYDADNDTDNQIQKNDIFAFRLKNKAIQTLQRVNLSRFSKNGCADNAGSWMNITDSGLINISDLHIQTTNSQCFNLNTQKHRFIDIDTNRFPCFFNQADADFYQSGDRLVETRFINIQITAHLATDVKLIKELNQQVRVRNDIAVLIP
jgi:prepilin peptidase dependent protein B